MGEVKLCPKASLISICRAGWKMPEGVTPVLDSNQVSELLLKEVREASKSGDVELAHSIAVMAHAIRIPLEARDPDRPYPMFFVTPKSRGLNIDDFSDAHLDIFEYILRDASSPVIVSRLSDILWLRRREIGYANRALESLIIEASRARSMDKACVDRIQQLWHQTGSDPEIGKRIAALKTI